MLKIDKETIDKIKQAVTDDNFTAALSVLAESVKTDVNFAKILKNIGAIEDLEGYLPIHLSGYRSEILDKLLMFCKLQISSDNYNELHNAFVDN